MHSFAWIRRIYVQGAICTHNATDMGFVVETRTIKQTAYTGSNSR